MDDQDKQVLTDLIVRSKLVSFGPIKTKEDGLDFSFLEQTLRCQVGNKLDLIIHVEYTPSSEHKGVPYKFSVYRES